MLRFLLTIFLCNILFCIGAQSSIDEVLDCTNKYLGSDDFIVNGSRYLPPNSQITGNVYYESWAWMPGVVYIQSTPYELQYLKYDVFQDQLITQRNGDRGAVYQIILNASIIDSFKIDNRLFVNKKNLLELSTDKEYIEKIGNEQKLYRIQSIFYSAQFNRRNPFGRYQYSRPKFYHLTEQGVIKINNVKELAEMHPEHKKAILQFAKQSKTKLNRASHAQISELLNMIDAL